MADHDCARLGLVSACKWQISTCIYCNYLICNVPWVVVNANDGRGNFTVSIEIVHQWRHRYHLI